MDDLSARNRRVARIVFLAVFGMLVLAFASVPLYRKICQVTGWGGATQEVDKNPFQKTSYQRVFTVRFNADTDPALPWGFKPERNSLQVRVGQDGFISYKARNLSKDPVTGTAVYNVTPLQAGKYFYKTQCFCFGEQILTPGQEQDMPVVFFIDPKILEDRDLKDLSTITLSYTFYKKDTQTLATAIENFVNSKDNSP